jgi:hypothetical protein
MKKVLLVILAVAGIVIGLTGCTMSLDLHPEGKNTSSR